MTYLNITEKFEILFNTLIDYKLILLFAIAAFGIVFQWNSCRNLE